MVDSKTTGDSKDDCMDHDDILLAHKYRVSLASSPSQSSFRVVALVFLETIEESLGADNTFDLQIAGAPIRSDDGRLYVVGTNDEPGYIGGSICAERAALVRLRFLPNVRVSRIAIVTDSETPISPGMLCREFMAGHSQVPWNVSILLAGSVCRACGADFSTTKDVESLEENCPKHHEKTIFRRHRFSQTHTTLRQLFPHPSPFSRLVAAQAVQVGEKFGALMPSTRIDSRMESNLLELPQKQLQQRLLQMARAVSNNDSRSDLHPIKFGAVVLYNNGRTDTAFQKKALEYPCTLDAVSQLATKMEHERSKSVGSARPLLIVQSDQFGIAHAPFAKARAFLSEHGYSDCQVLVHKFLDESVAAQGDSTTAELVSVTVSELAPSAPDIGRLWID